jgi:hypothetical protein
MPEPVDALYFNDVGRLKTSDVSAALRKASQSCTRQCLEGQYSGSTRERRCKKPMKVILEVTVQYPNAGANTRERPNPRSATVPYLTSVSRGKRPRAGSKTLKSSDLLGFFLLREEARVEATARG